MIDPARVLKHGDTFAVFGPLGDIDKAGSPESGLYHLDTRFLSKFALRLGTRDLKSNSAVSADGAILTTELIDAGDGRSSALYARRTRFLWDATLHERLLLENRGDVAIDISLCLEFDADYADLFEVRGIRRAKRGHCYPPSANRNTIEFRYEGLDRQLRRTVVELMPAPVKWSGPRAEYFRRIEVGASETFEITICCQPTDEPRLNFDQAATKSASRLRAFAEKEPNVSSSNAEFEAWLRRSVADLHLMLTETSHGLYPYAGLPWYSTAFGRDGIITAMECLWFDPSVARGVLAYLAITQAADDNPERDAQPGKILHETRAGEMAALGEVPFDRYYGSIDATPLFVMLAGAYFERTGDIDFVRSIWPNIGRALNWIDQFGDIDGDGFAEYAPTSRGGLRNQSWKDSDGAIFHADGKLADPPIAVCEVQGYVYGAKLAGAKLARDMGELRRASELENQVEQMRSRFEKQFWCEEIGSYALALDGEKRACRVRSSNAGQCLFAGIASRDHAERVARALLEDDMFSGWGVRTISRDAIGYDPGSYHNGSIWPHDNALIAAGLARYGFKSAAARIFEALFDVSSCFELRRLPELFCGNPRVQNLGPAPYPVSCSPQTWGSCAVFLLIGALLGIEFDYPSRKIVFAQPYLPDSLPEIRISRLQLGSAKIDLVISGSGSDVKIDVRECEGDASVEVRRG